MEKIDGHIGSYRTRLIAEKARHHNELQSIRQDAMDDRAELDRVIQMIDGLDVDDTILSLTPVNHPISIDLGKDLTSLGSFYHN